MNEYNCSSISILNVAGKSPHQAAPEPQRRKLDGLSLDVGSQFRQSDGSGLRLKPLTGRAAFLLNLSHTHLRCGLLLDLANISESDAR